METFTETLLDFTGLKEGEIKKILGKYGIGMTPSEAKQIQRALKRPLTLTEAVIWGIQGSEHCSYKSSKQFLKKLPTSGPNVILGPGEDAGIIEIAEIEVKEKGRKVKKRYGMVVAHESHNHPSQIVPFEGAATGIGGVVRDVLCMGAKVVAVADPLRFGNIKRKETAAIAEGVVEGIAGYGNPIGVPNIAGDVYFDDSFNTNSLVNVLALGLLQEDELIHSRAPRGADGYDIIIVGKATDETGMGGAAMASLGFGGGDKAAKSAAELDAKRAAVQVPNPFLKRHLLESTYDLFKFLKKKRYIGKVGFKDLGGGGVTCASVEMAFAGGYGAEIDLEKVPVSREGLHPSVIACSETQERLLWMVPKKLSKTILDHYNKKWDLPAIAKGACAAVIGKVKRGNYVLKYKGVKVCDAAPKLVCEGLQYRRALRARRKGDTSAAPKMPRNFKKVFLQVMSHENVASRQPIYEKYDKNVQGISVIEAGQADAGVIAPLRNREDIPAKLQHVGVALSVDANPRYGLIDPYWQAANAVVEGMRNVAAVGATPWCVTDCLNYGNPEVPVHMWEFSEGVAGLADALNALHLKGYKGAPVPCISGNVSFYNVSQKKSIAPQAIVGTLGRMSDARKAITMKLKEAGSELYLIGPRLPEMGGSVYYSLFNKLGKKLPEPNFDQVRAEIYAVIDIITEGLARSCHDISEGGLAACIAEMCLGGDGLGKIGARIDTSNIQWHEVHKKGRGKNAVRKLKGIKMRADEKLFSETGGFVLELSHKHAAAAKKISSRYKVPLLKLGRTTKRDRIAVWNEGEEILKVELSSVRRVWMGGLRDKL